jgi:MFS family permease
MLVSTTGMSMVWPLLGGFLNDNFNPRAIWYGGGAAGILGPVVFLVLVLRTGNNKSPSERIA